MSSDVALASVRHSLLGAVRLSMLEFFGVDGIVERYRVWLAVYFYVAIWSYVNGENEFAIIRGLKRGDDNYSYYTCKKFNQLTRFGKNHSFFDFGSHSKVSGSGLLVTLEYDSNRVSVGDAWQNVGFDLNRWICGIRRRFGSVSMVRVFESHDSGYPHVHALLIFHNCVFSGRSWRNKRGKLIYRVIGSDFDALKSLSNGADRWNHGYSDFELVSSYRGGIRYLAKYLSKSTSFKEAGSKGAKTLAMCWFFHKRSFGYQGEMFAFDEIQLECNSNLSDENSSVSSDFVLVGIDLFLNPVYEKVVRWHLLGFIRRTVPLWRDKSSFHKVRGSDLQLVERRSFNGLGIPDLFDVSSKVVFSSVSQKRLALFDDHNSCRKLTDFSGGGYE